ncbi:TerC family protein [Pseudomonas chlororaphis]|uniref:TerC family protein n=1 Tax=Pseudomonas chlororaphis TaxID=587753 RepID=UPI003BF7E8EE
MFIFVMIFGYFAVPPELQRRVLLYGVLGAIVMRGAMIFAGVWLVSQFAWLLYAFGVPDHHRDQDAALRPPAARPRQEPLLRWVQGHLRITKRFHDEHFFVLQNGRRWATPMFLVLG